VTIAVAVRSARTRSASRDSADQIDVAVALDVGDGRAFASDDDDGHRLIVAEQRFAPAIGERFILR
jgi:hypothetical protein